MTRLKPGPAQAKGQRAFLTGAISAAGAASGWEIRLAFRFCKLEIAALAPLVRNNTSQGKHHPAKCVAARERQRPRQPPVRFDVMLSPAGEASLRDFPARPCFEPGPAGGLRGGVDANQPVMIRRPSTPPYHCRIVNQCGLIYFLLKQFLSHKMNERLYKEKYP